jgi:hypothetical protein
MEGEKNRRVRENNWEEGYDQSMIYACIKMSQ